MIDNPLVVGRRVSLDTLGKYIDSFSQWKARKKIGWDQEKIIYTNPKLEESNIEGGRKPIDEFDELMGHFDTSEINGSKTSSELFEEIRLDPSHLRLLDSSIFYIMDKWLALIASLGIIIVAVYFEPIISMYSNWPLVITVVLVFLSPFWFIATRNEMRKKRQYGFFLNELGIARYGHEIEDFYFGDTIAICWEHVEWVDIEMNEGKLVYLRLAGNQRIVKYYLPKKGKKLSLQLLRKYLPDYESWRSYEVEGWHGEATRYRKTQPAP